MADENRIDLDAEAPLRSFRRAIGDPGQDVMAAAIGIGSGTYGASERSAAGVRVQTVARALAAHGYRLVMVAERVPAEERAAKKGAADG